VAQLFSLGGKYMHSISSNRIEIVCKSVAKVVAVVFSLIAWAFIIMLVVFWGQIGDYLTRHFNPYVASGICWVCGAYSFLLFVRLTYDSQKPEIARFWLIFSGASIILLPLLAGLNYICCLFRL
jgi:hypothetical protein